MRPATGGTLRLSVVVTVVDGGPALEACLASLFAQSSPPTMEILVPFDDTVEGIRPIRERFGDAVRFLRMEATVAELGRARLATEHERYDRRRALGLAEALGEIVAILEDRSVPRGDWASTVDVLHRMPHLVIGGAIENAVDRVLNWAVYFCDFGRYQPPFVGGSARWVSDVNVSYKRAALERTRALWRERYHETTVHWALQREGHVLLLSPDMVVRQHRRDLQARALLFERFHWGRLFAYTRVRARGVLERLGWIAVSPLLPVVLFARLVGTQLRRRASPGRFLIAVPAILVLLVAWSVGELTGYLTRRP